MTAAGTAAGPLRLDIDAEDVGKGLGRLVLALLEIVRQLLERQALRRMDANSLTSDEIERLGTALLDMEDRFAELRRAFGVPEGSLGLTSGLDSRSIAGNTQSATPRGTLADR